MSLKRRMQSGQVRQFKINIPAGLPSGFDDDGTPNAGGFPFQEIQL